MILKNKFVKLAVVLGCLYGLFHITWYGFNFSYCIYTDKIISMPADLQNTTILMEEDAYVVKGKDPDGCSFLLKSIQNSIIGAKSFKSVGTDYYMNQGRSVENLKSGKVFRLDKIVAQTKHGISTIDSGPGPINFLVLTDDQGVVYKLATPLLGFDEKEAYLSYSKDGTRKGMLSWEYFYNLGLENGK